MFNRHVYVRPPKLICDGNNGLKIFKPNNGSWIFFIIRPIVPCGSKLHIKIFYLNDRY
jgi:hypothetical protein